MSPTTDVAALCRVWNAHYAELGHECLIDPLRFELCSLAKPYFRAEDLLLAEQEGRVVGFLHMGQVGNADLSDASAGEAAIAALCVEPGEDERAIGGLLLAAAEKHGADEHVRRCRFKPTLPDCAFYLGLGPGNSLIGATAAEKRVIEWVGQAGFKPVLPTTLWELELFSFQPPIDRVQIQIRRSACLDRQADEPDLPWWQACLLGHTERTAIQLINRADERVLCKALFWSVANELQSTADATLWLWPIALTSAEQAVDQMVFLLGESCRQLQHERTDVVRTVSTASDTVTSSILRRVGFKACESGMVFEKLLD
ncbi:MAG: GNAT family N-acetyltransferase [Planctomycetales bacterium]|nr:GNAT family N-acetyltransferase [Planctomycetales bacterium]